MGPQGCSCRPPPTLCRVDTMGLVEAPAEVVPWEGFPAGPTVPGQGAQARDSWEGWAACQGLAPLALPVPCGYGPLRDPLAPSLSPFKIGPPESPLLLGRVLQGQMPTLTKALCAALGEGAWAAASAPRDPAARRGSGQP